jgi:hypothetical protein
MGKETVPARHSPSVISRHPWGLGGLLLGLGLLAFGCFYPGDPGVIPTFINDAPVPLYIGSTRVINGAARLVNALRQDPGGRSTVHWPGEKGLNTAFVVAGWNEEQQLVFCQVYSFEDSSLHNLVVRVNVDENHCPSDLVVTVGFLYTQTPFR